MNTPTAFKVGDVVKLNVLDVDSKWREVSGRGVTGRVLKLDSSYVTVYWEKMLWRDNPVAGEASFQYKHLLPAYTNDF